MVLLFTVIFVFFILVSDELVESDFPYQGDALFLAHGLDLGQDHLILEGIRVDHWHVSTHRWVGWVVLLDVASCLWDGQNDVLGVHSTVQETLNHTVSVQSASIDHTVGGSASVSKCSHERAVLVQVLVQVWVIHGENTLGLLDLLLVRGDALRGVL